MIGFELDTGEVITARTDQTIEFELNNPALDNDLIPGSHSMEVSIDDVDGNMRKLEYANRHDKLTRNTVFDNVRLIILGNKQYKGKLVIRRLRDNGVDAFLVLNGFSIDALNQKLNQMDYGTPVVLGTTPTDIADEAATYVTENYPDVAFNFPMLYQPNQYNGAGLSWLAEDNVEDWDSGATYSVTNSAKYNGIIYFCKEETAAGESPYTHPSKWVATSSYGLINNWHAITFRSNQQTYARLQNAYALAPQPYVKHILQCIGSTLGYIMKGEFMLDDATDQLMVLNARTLDQKATEVWSEAQNDGIYDANTNPDAVGTHVVMALTGYHGDYIHFNDIISDPNGDFTVEPTPPTYPDPPSYYTVHSEGMHRLNVHLDLLSGSDPPFQLTVHVGPDPIVVWPEVPQVAEYVFDTVGVIDHTFEFYVDETHIGDPIYLKLRNSLALYDFEYNAGTSMRITNMNANEYNEYDGEVDLANHVPDATVAEFLIALRDRFNLSVSLDPFTRTVRLDYRKSILTRKPQDYTDIIQGMDADVGEPQGMTITDANLVAVEQENRDDRVVDATFVTYTEMTSMTGDHRLDDFVYVTAQNAYYTLAASDIGVRYWLFSGTLMPKLVYGDGKRTLTQQAQPAQMKYLYKDGDYVLVPWSNLVGNSPLLNTGTDNKAPIVFATWYGMQDSEQGDFTYPFASGSIYDATGAEIGNTDLRFIETLPESVWQQYFEDWVRKVDYSLSFEADAVLSYKQIFELDMRSPIRRRFVRYVISRVIYEVDQQGKITAEVQAVKIVP